MKQIITRISYLLIIAFALATPKASQAQTSEAEVISFMRNYGNWKPTAENRWANLEQGASTTWRCRYFQDDVEYAIVAFSEDGDVTDMDVTLRYCDGTYFDSDDDVDDWGILVFTGGGRNMDYKMTNYRSDDPYYESRCQYIIFYR